MGGTVDGMTLTFAGTLDRCAVTATVDQLTDLVGSAEVADAWELVSALPGMTVGGLARHLVSQPECAVEFLTTPGPPDAQVLTLLGHYERVDWLHAPVDAPENTSIRDDFNQMARPGAPSRSRCSRGHASTWARRSTRPARRRTCRGRTARCPPMTSS